MPPPRVSPPIPVVEMIPPVVASPEAAVASLNRPHVVPPPATAVRAPGSTSTACMDDRSTTTASSAVPKPGTLCPPPRTATAWPFSAAYRTAATTSSVPAQRTTRCGRASIMAL